MDARNKLFKQYTAPLKKSSRFNLTTLAKQFDGYSASDIKDVCQGAQLLVVNELYSDHPLIMNLLMVNYHKTHVS